VIHGWSALARLVPGDYDQLHHFIADGVWDAAPLEAELLVQADRLVGGKDAVLVIDDELSPSIAQTIGVRQSLSRYRGSLINLGTGR
jgi:hypothetical protein